MAVQSPSRIRELLVNFCIAAGVILLLCLCFMALATSK
jgi:hypothetical protein